MPLTGRLRTVSLIECPHCKIPYGKHSKKNFLKCLHITNIDLYKCVQQIKQLKKELYTINNIPENIVVENGSMDVKE